MEFLIALSGILITVKVLGHLVSKIGLPAVVGKLFAGIILGPAILNLYTVDTHLVHIFGEMGVIMLMFYAGLECDLKVLKMNIKQASLVAIFGILIPMGMTFTFAYFFGFDLLTSMFLAVIFSATSVSISIQVLKDFKFLDSTEASVILGAALIDDVISVTLLGVLISFVPSDTQSASLGFLLLLKVLFFMFAFVAVKYIVPMVLRFSKRISTSESVITFSLVICMTIAFIAEVMGMGIAIGAFFAGLAISLSDVKHQVEESISPIANALFIPVFFVSIGLNMQFTGIEGKHIMFMIIMSVIAVASKLIGCYLPSKLTGMSKDSSMVVASGMISRGEMAIIIAVTAYEAGVLSQEYFSSVVFAVIVTTIVAPIIMKFYITKIKSQKI